MTLMTPGGEGVPERREQGGEQQHPQLRRLEDDAVPHDQGGNEGGEGLVQGVVEGAHAQGHPQRRPPDLGDDIFLDDEPGIGPVLLLVGLDGIVDVEDGAVEFLFRILAGLADLPHEELHHLGPALLHAKDKLLHLVDALLDTGGGPVPPAVVPGRHRRVQGLLGRLQAQEREMTQFGRGQARTGPEKNRGKNLLHGAVPPDQVPPGQVGVLGDEAVQTHLPGNVRIPRKQ